MFDDCHWLNEPREWQLHPAGLTVTTDHGTDFWRETHYGFTRHSGHFFGRDTSRSFTATIRIRARYESLYDQAGIMVRLDDANWIKAGIELSDGQALLSSVLTVGQSDYCFATIWLRVAKAREKRPELLEGRRSRDDTASKRRPNFVHGN
jgi:regulation of enolase protein 1 (concanavalin A-like superfamily)